MFVYDNVDPRTLDRILSLAGLKKTAVNVITKSGSTAETIASFMILWDKMNSAVSDSAKNFIATIDPEKGSLRKIADEKGFRTLSIPQGVVGRYSVLSPVGLLCAEVAGVDSGEMLKGARDIHSKCSDAEIWKNPAYLFRNSSLSHGKGGEEKHKCFDSLCGRTETNGRMVLPVMGREPREIGVRAYAISVTRHNRPAFPASVMDGRAGG